MLVKWGVDLADELGLESYLESSALGKGLYEKFGFECARLHNFDASEFGGKGGDIVAIMVRQPRKKTADSD